MGPRKTALYGERVDAELKYLIGSINELAEGWLLDKTSPFYLAGQGMGPYKGEVQTWWFVCQRSGSGHRKYMGGIMARELPHKRTRLVFALLGFPDPDLFRKIVKKIVEKLKREGFAPQPPLAGDEAGKMGIFFSYAHEDEKLRDELEKHLSTLKRQGVITSWHDRKIGAGKEWKGEIDTHLDTAHMILLLISADFMDSDYCWDVEVKRAMERHEAGEARVIPVILRPVEWRGAPFGKLQALPTDAKPVTSWENRDEAFLDIAQGIRAAVMELRMGDNDSDPNHEKHDQSSAP